MGLELDQQQLRGYCLFSLCSVPPLPEQGHFPALQARETPWLKPGISLRWRATDRWGGGPPGENAVAHQMPIRGAGRTRVWGWGCSGLGPRRVTVPRVSQLLSPEHRLRGSWSPDSGGGRFCQHMQRAKQIGLAACQAADPGGALKGPLL